MGTWRLSEDDIVLKEIKLRSGRESPMLSYQTTAKPGQKLQIVRKSGDNWVKVKPVEGMTAWITAEYVKLS